MIKINYCKGTDGVIRSLNEIANVHYQLITSGATKMEVLTNLENLECENQMQFAIKKYLVDEFQLILTKDVEGLGEVIELFKVRGWQDVLEELDDEQIKLNDFGKAIKICFNYDGFRQSAKPPRLHKMTNIKTCPYCNAQFLLTNKDKKLRFQLDHYYPQSRFPYLSLSFYNLVPSCSSCNQKKSDLIPDPELDFHPYYSDLDKISKFGITHNHYLKWLGGVDVDSSAIELVVRDDASVVEKLFLEKHKKTTGIEGLYEGFSDHVAEIFESKICYNSSKRKELINFFSNKKINDFDIDKFIFRNYTKREDINKRPLTKLTKDIIDVLF